MRYRMQEGMIAWLLHRIAGLAILSFLMVHILDITLAGWGPHLFNKLLFMYRETPFRVMEVALLGAVLYHALNGLRIIAIDFWSAGPRWQKHLFYGVLAVCAAALIPSAYIMLR